MDPETESEAKFRVDPERALRADRDFLDTIELDSHERKNLLLASLRSDAMHKLREFPTCPCGNPKPEVIRQVGDSFEFSCDCGYRIHAHPKGAVSYTTPNPPTRVINTTGNAIQHMVDCGKKYADLGKPTRVIHPRGP